MNIFRNIDEISYKSDTILTVGTFDGVHIGHQQVIKLLKSISINNNLRHILITIEPHPQIVLNKSPEIKLLSTIEERLELFEKFGVENVYVILFSKEFSELSPESFIIDFLYKKIGFKKILIGYDHFFGKNREGNKEFLIETGKKYNFEVEIVAEFENNNKRISSTIIRKLIRDNNIKEANELLGYNYFINGNVIIGDKRGRTLNLPTANILPTSKYKLIPPNGVYFVSSIINNSNYFGMCNIGKRPTFTDGLKNTIEVHYFNFNDDIYNINLNVNFIEYLRPELKFNSVDEFLNQINIDKQTCLSLIETNDL